MAQLFTHKSGLGPYKFALLIVFLLVTQAACKKRSSRLPPPLPPAPNLEQQAETYFEQGDLEKAAAAYQRYLDHSSEAGTDQALFRLALIYLLPTSPVHDPARAQALLDRLTKEWGTSPYAGLARLLVQQADQLQQAQSGLKDREAQIKNWEAQIKNREARIEKLTEELEQLKEIDMRR